MTEQGNTIEAADILLDHRRRGATLNALPGHARPRGLDDAYAIQDAVIAKRCQESGTHPIGYKIGATNQGARTLLRVDGPFFGILLSSMTSESPAKLSRDGWFLRVVEPEIALLIGDDLDPAKAPFDADAVRAVTRAVLPAIEIVDTPFEPWTEAGGPSLIADDGAHGHWIKGAAIADFNTLDLLGLPVRLTAKGETVREGSGANVEGGPFAAAAWLANALAERGRALKAGDYVTTGTTTAPYQAAAGEAVTADFGLLGRVEVRFD
ncbi:MAG: fumarylacetoacetate hydrolase family protein [Alphaproteobacteria bacterium]|nr:fumarylacetoacetate hydrolase family protein [Alphaproteobacteria bacterium]